jgi:hypothetical protein
MYPLHLVSTHLHISDIQDLCCQVGQRPATTAFACPAKMGLAIQKEWCTHDVTSNTASDAEEIHFCRGSKLGDIKA